MTEHDKVLAEVRQEVLNAPYNVSKQMTLSLEDLDYLHILCHAVRGPAFPPQFEVLLKTDQEPLPGEFQIYVDMWSSYNRCLTVKGRMYQQAPERDKWGKPQDVERMYECKFVLCSSITLNVQGVMEIKRWNQELEKEDTILTGTFKE